MSEKKKIANIIFDDNNRVKYKKGAKLGGGGFGEVYEFIDQKTNKIYAGKIIPISTIEKNPQNNTAFNYENKFNNILDFEYLCKCYSTFKDTENAYFLLEYHPNKTLNELLNTRGTLTEFEVKHYGYQLLLAVEYLHSKNIIHRDLKLSNVLLSSRLEVKLCDFGLAIENGGEGVQSICGTPNYIAPEILLKKNGSYSFEVDIWSFGVILYTLLFHKTPFEEEGKGKTKFNILHLNYKFPSNTTVSSEAMDLIKKILVKDPLTRPTIEEIKNSEFFNKGIDIPKYLPITTLTQQPSEEDIKKIIANANDDGECMDRVFLEKSQGSFAKPNFIGGNIYGSFNDKESENLSEDNSDEEVNTANKNTNRNNMNISVGNSVDLRSESTSTIRENMKTPRLGYAKKPTVESIPTLFHNNEEKDTISLNTNNGNNNTSTNSTATINNLVQNPLNFKQRLSQQIDQMKAAKKNIFTVERFIDISDKYGIGYLMSNGNTGVYFNDGSKMLLMKNTNFFYYIDKSQSVSQHSTRSYPESLKSKVQLLKLFHKNIIRNLKNKDEYDVNPLSQLKPLSTYAKKWEKTKYASFFLLSNNIIQVIFNDKTEVHFNLEDKTVNYIDKSKNRIKEKLNAQFHYPNKEMSKRVLYAKNILMSRNG